MIEHNNWKESQPQSIMDHFNSLGESKTRKGDKMIRFAYCIIIFVIV